MTFTKKLLAAMLAVTIIAAAVPLALHASADSDGIQKKLDELRAVYHDGTYFTVDGNPCYLCARMRRGHLYAKARELGCNKIVLGHHLNDVIETTVLAMFYGAQLQGMMPKLHSTNFPGMELIRPLYCVREDDIVAWARYNGLQFIRCDCRMTEHSAVDSGASKRQEIKALIRSLRGVDPGIEQNIFNAIHQVTLDTFPAWKKGGVTHSFLETYDRAGEGEEGTDI